jgi:hypothetical protein
MQRTVAEYLTKFHLSEEKLGTLVYGRKAFILDLHIDCYIVPCLPVGTACRIRGFFFFNLRSDERLNRFVLSLN